ARAAIDRFHANEATRKAGESRIGKLRDRRLEIVAGSAAPRRERRRLEKRIAALSEAVERSPSPPDDGIGPMKQEVDATAARARRAQRVLQETRSLPAPTRPEPLAEDDHTAHIGAAQSRIAVLSDALAEARKAVEDAVSKRRRQREGQDRRRAQIAEAKGAATTHRDTVRAAIAAIRRPVAVATVSPVPTSLRLALDAARAEVDAAQALRAVCIAGRPEDPPDAPPAPADVRPLRQAVARAEAASLDARTALVDHRTTRKAHQTARRASIAGELDRARAQRSAIRSAAQSAREAVPVAHVAGVAGDIILAASLTRAALDESRSVRERLATACPTAPGPGPQTVPPSHVETAGANLRDAMAAAAASVLEARAGRAARSERIASLQAIAARKRDVLTTTPSRPVSPTAAVRDS
ncbi:MAG: hypothetical protein VX000_15000, partial [Myxococcota bacterium]|nr:hypothetical protein [Myxococcota bacterium]